MFIFSYLDLVFSYSPKQGSVPIKAQSTIHPLLSQSNL